jgi:hypothetical protein
VIAVTERQWGEWTMPCPLPEPDAAPTAATHEIRLRLTRAPHGAEASPVRYRTGPRASWQEGRVCGWARAHGTRAWSLCALTHLSARRPASDTGNVWSGYPRWRTSWVLHDPALIESTQPARYPTDYWRDELSAHLRDFGDWYSNAGTALQPWPGA